MVLSDPRYIKYSCFGRSEYKITMSKVILNKGFL